MFTYIHEYMSVCGHIHICMYVYEILYPKNILCPFPFANIYIIYCIYNIYLGLCQFESSHFIKNTFKID